MTRPISRIRAPRLEPALVGAVVLTLLAALPLAAQPQPQPQPTDPPVPTPTGDTSAIFDESYISQGKVPIVAFLEFIQRSTGRLVTYPSTGPSPEFDPNLTIDVLADVRPLTYPIVKALLEANGYELVDKELEDGSVVINVSHMASRGRVDTVDTPEIIKPSTPLLDNEADQLATLVLQLRYAETQTVIQALRDILGVGAQSRSSAVKIVNVANTQTLIIKAKKLILKHIQELMEYIDVEVTGPESVLRIVPIYNADAQELVTTIQEVLDVPLTGSARSGARATGGRSPGNAAAASRVGGDSDRSTRLIADVRTQKIIIDTTSEEDLELILNLIDELDAEVENLRPSNHIYRVQFLKAADLQEDLQQLLDGTRQTGGLAGRGGARGAAARGGARGAAAGQQGQQQILPSRVISHDETNSLIVQAEYEEYLEILKILEAIDIKRRQVFLEVALVQVNQSSTLNYTLEYLAGNLDDEATRVAALTAFGLSTLDVTQLPDNFERAFNPAAPQTGLLAAVSRDGQLPVLLRAIKSDTDSKIIATPFILADDNQQNNITVETEIFFATSTLNDNFSQGGQSSESAGVTLSLLPTISENVVLLELNLEFSVFAAAQTGETLPDRNTNTVESRVTIPDGQLFIIGGLARSNESLAVDKVPILGDIPLIGRFFQSRTSDKRRDNLYVFLNAHIISGDDYSELEDLTQQAHDQMSTYDENYRVQETFQSTKDDSDDDRLPPNPEETGLPRSRK